VAGRIRRDGVESTMKVERLYPDKRLASRAGGDAGTLKAMQDALRRNMAQGVIEATREARSLQQLDPDLVIEEMEKYFGPKGAWADLLSDAFWEFENKSFSDYEENAGALWSEAGR
jgi:hypothetical protein